MWQSRPANHQTIFPVFLHNLTKQRPLLHCQMIKILLLLRVILRQFNEGIFDLFTAAQPKLKESQIHEVTKNIPSLFFSWARFQF